MSTPNQSLLIGIPSWWQVFGVMAHFTTPPPPLLLQNMSLLNLPLDPACTLGRGSNLGWCARSQFNLSPAWVYTPPHWRRNYTSNLSCRKSYRWLQGCGWKAYQLHMRHSVNLSNFTFITSHLFTRGVWHAEVVVEILHLVEGMKYLNTKVHGDDVTLSACDDTNFRFVLLVFTIT